MLQENAFGFLSRAQLVRLRLRAVRAGVWFSVLPRIDRVLVDLTIRVAGSVRSVTLARSISVVARKLEGLFASKLELAITKIGFPIACKLGMLAQKWSNEDAKEWATDANFMRYLAVMSLNSKLELTKR